MAMDSDTAPLVLTLKLDPFSLERLDGLRRAYFPPERNFLLAHLTFFHALPREQEPSIRDLLTAVSAETGVLPVRFPGLRSLGRGVAVEVEAPEVTALRARLADEWRPWLTAQDRERFRPHVTIQNKVAAETARLLHDELASNWSVWEGLGMGLSLWYYRGGPWESAGGYAFRA